MKQKVSFMAMLLMALMVPRLAQAYDFSYTYEGNTLYYNIRGNNVYVTGPGQSDWGPYSGYTEPSGSLIIPSSVTHNGVTYSVTKIDDGAFSFCTGITSVTIPNSVTIIGESAFTRCTGITSVTIPNSVTRIGACAFSECNNITEIHAMPVTPPTLGDRAFYLIGLDIQVFIPCDATGYRITEGWKSFTNIQEPTAPVISVTGEEHGDVTIQQATCDNPMATLTATPNTGYRFVKWDDGNTDNPRFIQMEEDRAIGVVFDTDAMYTVTVNNAYGGGLYYSGSNAILMALPQVNGQFAGWSDGETANPRSVVVTGDITLEALFRAPDTVRIYDTITVFDTVINIVYDTTEYNHYYYDTTRVFDTVVNIVYDTTRVFDTMVYVNIDTLNHYFYDTTEITHYVFESTWVFDTIYLFDTIHIHDTVVVTQEGIEGVPGVSAKIYQRDGQLVVEGAEGHRVVLYDAVGRMLATKREDGEMVRFDVPATGTYLVRIGNAGVRKVVLVR